MALPQRSANIAMRCDAWERSPLTHFGKRVYFVFFEGMKTALEGAQEIASVVLF
jgi:hypothetical protein